MTHYPVPDRLVRSVHLKSLLLALDALHEIMTKDPQHDERIRAAASRLEEIFGAYCTLPRVGGLVLDSARRFKSLAEAYRIAIDALSTTCCWIYDDEGNGWNRWADLSYTLHLGLVRATWEGL